MKINQLRNLIAHGETSTVEFKTSTAQLRSAFETICAFLNGKGGSVFIGVNNNGDLVGQDITDNTRQEIAREIAKIEPAIPIEIDYILINKNKYVISVTVHASEYAPHIYDGRSFQRHESTTNKMSQHRYEQLLIKRGNLNHSWDEQLSDIDINDLDHEEIKRTIELGIKKNRIAFEVINFSIEKMLSYLKLLKNGGITNAAAVLYAKDVKEHYSQCLIRMTRYQGTDKLSNFIDSKHVYGNTFDILNNANYFIMQHLPVSSFFEINQFRRIDEPALPVMAIREALLNAITHRDYSNRLASISLAIFNDRLEIWNNGTLTPNLELKDLKTVHESYPRNKKIANVFYSIGLVEKAGIGTLRMIEDCKLLGIAEPIFEEYSSGFSVIFKFKNHLVRSDSSKRSPLTERQQEILKILETAPLNSAQIVNNLKTSPSRRMVQLDLTKLEKLGLVERLGESRLLIWRLVK